MSAPLNLPRAHGQERLAALKGLNLALLVNAEHHRVERRFCVKAHKVTNLFDELGILRERETLAAMGLQAESPPNAADALHLLTRDRPFSASGSFFGFAGAPRFSISSLSVISRNNMIQANTNKPLITVVGEIDPYALNDAIIDPIGPQNGVDNLRLLAPEGGVAFIGGLPDLSRVDDLPYSIAIHDIGLGGVLVAPQFRRLQEDLGRMAAEMIALVAGEIRSTVSEVISLEEIPKGLATLAEGHVRGKIVARVRA
jgi:hypothetical protein